MPSMSSQSVPNYHANAQAFIKSAKSKGMPVKAEGSELIAYPKPKPGYHEGAQKFIKSAKSKGMPVKAEGSELIAYPPKMKQNMQSLKGRSNIRISK